jgi:hypothetical protein
MKSNADEIVIRESRCMYRRHHSDPFDWAGGKVLLTKNRLSFVPSFFDLGNAEHSISLEDIVSIQAKYSCFISNKFSVLCKDGSINEFRVPKRKDWLITLEEALKEKKGGGADWKTSSTPFSTPKNSMQWYVRITIQVLFLAFCVSVLAFIFQIVFSE